MSKVTKRKHVMKEMQTDDFDPPGPNQQIVRIIGSRGNNLHEVESAECDTTSNGNNAAATGDGDNNAERFLVSMPTKFRKNVWVKRGDFVIVEPIDEGDKVKAEIIRILTPQHIKEFTKDGIWPEKFTAKNTNDSKKQVADSQSDEDDNDDDLFKNTNRVHQNVEYDEDSDDESDDESDTEGSSSDDDNDGND